jgi:hypothetical protein
MINSIYFGGAAVGTSVGGFVSNLLFDLMDNNYQLPLFMRGVMTRKIVRTCFHIQSEIIFKATRITS